MLDGVVLYLIPGTLVKQRSPWQRTYKDNQLAPWEESTDYCQSVFIYSIRAYSINNNGTIRKN